MKLFHLIREIDDSGTSGTGFVCEGVEFDDGVCVIHWIVGEEHSTTVFSSVERMIKIHGHNGHTRIEWVEE